MWVALRLCLFLFFAGHPRGDVRQFFGLSLDSDLESGNAPNDLNLAASFARVEESQEFF